MNADCTPSAWRTARAPTRSTRANEVERLEALTREAEQLELRIQEAERR